MCLRTNPSPSLPRSHLGLFLGYSPPRLRVLGGHRACQRTDTNQNFWGRCWKIHNWVGRDLKAHQIPTLHSSRGSQGTLAHLHKAKSVPRASGSQCTQTERQHLSDGVPPNCCIAPGTPTLVARVLEPWHWDQGGVGGSSLGNPPGCGPGHQLGGF